MAVQKIQYRTLDENTKQEVKKIVGTIVVSICNIHRLRFSRGASSACGIAFDGESDRLYQSVMRLNNMQFKGDDLRKYRQFIKSSFNRTYRDLPSILNCIPLFKIVHIHTLACICSNLYDTTDLCVKAMTMTDSKALMEILEL